MIRVENYFEGMLKFKEGGLATTKKETSVAVASILSAVVISLFNILAVISLTMYDDGGKTDFKKIIIRTLKNPLIISIFLGVATIGLRNFVPFSIKNFKAL